MQAFPHPQLPLTSSITAAVPSAYCLDSRSMNAVAAALSAAARCVSSDSMATWFRSSPLTLRASDSCCVSPAMLASCERRSDVIATICTGEGCGIMWGKSGTGVTMC